MFEEAKGSPDIQGCELDFYPPPSPQDLELHDFMVTAITDDFDLHIPSMPLLFS